MAEIRTIVGIQKIKTKAGNTGYNISFIEPYSDYDLRSAENPAADLSGFKAGTQYASGDYGDLRVGDKVKMFFGDKVFNGSVMLDEIMVIEHGGNPFTKQDSSSGKAGKDGAGK